MKVVGRSPVVNTHSSPKLVKGDRPSGIVYSTPSPARSRLSLSRVSPGRYSSDRDPPVPRKTESRDPPISSMSKDEMTASTERLCDYDTNATALYEMLESSNWVAARDRCKTHPEEVRTWIVRKDKSLKVRWKLLPLHAAIIFQAPTFLISTILGKYASAASRQDDQGMLPLHLAFRHKQDDEDLLELLLVQNPKAVMTRDRRDRVPLEHGREVQFTAKMMRLYADATVAASRALQNNRESPRSSPRNSPTRNSPRNQALASQKMHGLMGDATKVAADYEKKLAAVKKDFIAKMSQQKRLYEERITTIREHNEVNARQMELMASDERQALVEKHASELEEVRELLHTQVAGDREQVKRLRREVETLQLMLEESKLEQERSSFQHNRMRSTYDEIREHLELLSHDQLRIRNLSLQLHDDQESQRLNRQQMVENLAKQLHMDVDSDRRRTEELLSVSDSIRNRITDLLENPAISNEANEEQKNTASKNVDSARGAFFGEDSPRTSSKSPPATKEGSHRGQRSMKPIVVSGENVEFRQEDDKDQVISRVERERHDDTYPEYSRDDTLRAGYKQPIKVQATEYYAEVPTSPKTQTTGQQTSRSKGYSEDLRVLGDEISAITETSVF